MRFTQEVSIFNPKAIAYAVTALGTRITQTAAEIRLEAAQTLSNYSTTIQMNAAISVKADEIAQTVSETYSTKQETVSQIAQTAHTISLGVTGKAGKTSGASIKVTLKDADGNMISEGSGNVLIDGNVIFSSQLTDGTTTISGSNIKTGTINANLVSVTNINADNITTGTLTGRTVSGGSIIQTVSGAREDGLPGNKSNGEQASIQNGVVKAGELAVKGSITTVSFVPEGGDGRGSYGIYCTGHFSTEGALWTNGEIGEADIICRGNAFAQNFIQSSDRDLKQDIEDLTEEEACRVVYGLNPVTFALKEQSKVKNHGFIAQDVQPLIKDNWGIVTETDIRMIGDRKALGINYVELIADLVAVLQSQNQRITLLERRNNG